MAELKDMESGVERVALESNVDVAKPMALNRCGTRTAMGSRSLWSSAETGSASYFWKSAKSERKKKRADFYVGDDVQDVALVNTPRKKKMKKKLLMKLWMRSKLTVTSRCCPCPN